MGDRRYAESVTETQHALQCATLAERAGEPSELIAACLLHDFGHLVHGLDEDIARRGIDGRHEDAGYTALRRFFPASVVDPGRLHVEAKRYLCATRDGYADSLSPASRRSLELQGGAMTPEEARRFELEPFWERAVRLREYDDMGKDPSMRTPGIAHFRALLESLVEVEMESKKEQR